MAERLTILTPWYPSPTKPFGGAFVRAMALAVSDDFDEMHLLHIDEWPLPAGRAAQRSVRRRMHAMLADPARRPRPRMEVEGSVTRVPVPTVPKTSFADAAHAAEAALRAQLDGGPIDSEVVHAHVGLPAGWAAVRLAPPSSRIFVTEHATFLDQMLAEDEGRRMYGEVLERCTAFFAVSELLREQVVREFPSAADKVHVVPNAIPFGRIPERPQPVTDLRRWLYLGSFQERKGVLHALEAFAICHLERPDLEFTLVGGGPQLPELTERVEQLGLAGTVRLLPAVEPDAVFSLLHDHDLLVHASRYETFGMTMIEALAAGTPVMVTRCGGPEETLSGIESIAGQLIDVGDGCLELVAGFRELSSRVGELDLHRAREVLATRYGFEAVREQLAVHYTSDARGDRS